MPGIKLQRLHLSHFSVSSVTAFDKPFLPVLDSLYQTCHTLRLLHPLGTVYVRAVSSHYQEGVTNGPVHHKLVCHF